MKRSLQDEVVAQTQLDKHAKVILLCVWGQEINISFVFIVCSFQLAWLEDMAKRRTLLKDEYLSPKIE